MTALITVFVPAGMEATTFEDHSIHNGRTTVNKYQTRPWNGWWVVDIPLAFFNRLIEGPKGLDWTEINAEVFVWLGEANRKFMSCNARRAPCSTSCADLGNGRAF